MKITADTTTDQILAPIKAAKERLLVVATEAAGSGNPWGEDLVTVAQHVRNTEAIAPVQRQYRNMLRNSATDVQRLVFLTEVLTSRNDTSSGRGNDSVRSTTDAISHWVRSEIDRIQYGH